MVHGRLTEYAARIADQADLTEAFLAALDETAPQHDYAVLDLLDVFAVNGWVFRDDYAQSGEERLAFAKALRADLKANVSGGASIGRIEEALVRSKLAITQMGVANEASQAYFRDLNTT